jgi:hypothetical protein
MLMDGERDSDYYRAPTINGDFISYTTKSWTCSVIWHCGTIQIIHQTVRFATTETKPCPQLIIQLTKPRPQCMIQITKLHPQLMIQITKPHPHLMIQITKPHPQLMIQITKPCPY